MSVEEVEKLYQAGCLSCLYGMDFLSDFSFEEMADAYNGIGPECMSEKDRKRLTKWLRLFAPACLIHDMRYECSDGALRTYYEANREFLSNCLILSDATYSWYNWKRYRARFVAMVMYAAVSTDVGWKSWQDCYIKHSLKKGLQ